MKDITNRKKITVISAIAVVGVIALMFSTSSEESVVSPLEQEVNDVRLATSTLPIAVSGIVEAASSATVYARTAGIVTAIPHKEGDIVTEGMVLAMQDTPVENAQIALASAQGALADIERAAQVSGKEATRDVAVVRAYSSTEIAAIRASTNDTRVSEAVAQVTASVQASMTTIVGTMDYINNNRSLLTAEGHSLYNEAVRLVYGNRLTYFDSSLLTGADNSPENTLQALLADEGATSPTTALLATSVTAEVLTLLNEALLTAEKDVFDRGEGTNDSATADYLAQKENVTVTLSSLEVARGNAAQIVDGTIEDAIGQKVAVDVTQIDREEAKRQAAFALQIAARSHAVSQATLGVASAQQSLGVATAPFAGVVSQVLVEEGTYVTAGTPLLQVIGAGAQELMVTVPDIFVESLATGQLFFVDGEMVGVVDRFSPVSEGRGHAVVIALMENVASTGATLHGHILTESTDTIYKVPRAYIHFTSSGPSIIYQQNERVLVDIVYDAGNELFIKTAVFKDEPLTPAIIITF